MIDLRNRRVCHYNCKYFDFSAAAAVSGSVRFRPVVLCVVEIVGRWVSVWCGAVATWHQIELT